MTIFDYDVELDLSLVSSVTSGWIQMVPGTKRTDDPWAINQCFELEFSSPYNDFGAYEPFYEGTTSCTVRLNFNLLS